MGEIRRIDEMGRRVRFFASQIAKEKDVVPIRSLYESAPLVTVGPRAAHTIDELDTTLAEHEQRLTKMNDSYETLSARTRELVEARHVLRETAVFFDKVRSVPTYFETLLNMIFLRLKATNLIYDRHLTTALHRSFKTTAKLAMLHPVFSLTWSEIVACLCSLLANISIGS